jgi:hypothetical protein
MFSSSFAGVSNKPVVILPLGLLFVPNDQLAFDELAKLIAQENHTKIRTTFYNSAKSDIERFKKGEMKEDDFDKSMVKLVKEILNTQITPEQFNACWIARYTDNSVKDLKSIISESKNHDFAIYSFTNPKDEQRIIKLCQEKKIDCVVENGHLKSVQGKDVRKTFSEQISKVELFKKIAKEKYQQGSRKIILIIGAEDGQTIPVLKAESEKLNQSLISVAESMNIQVTKVDPKVPLDINTLLKQERLTITCKL